MAFQQRNDGPLRELALFAGAGGGILGGKLLGWRTVCAVEIEEYPRKVLMQRQNDGLLEPFPVWDDVCTFDGLPWQGIVDVVSGGFPCQDISAAGKGAGIDGERSGLWSEMARIVGEVRPRFVWVENSPLLVSRGLDRCLSDLAAMGYDARWGIVGAHHAGAPHKRDRCWILAHADKERRNGRARVQRAGRRAESTNNGEGEDFHRVLLRGRRYRGVDYDTSAHWWATEPDLGRVAHGIPNRVDRLKAIGNGQCPQAMALAWRLLGGPVDG